MMITVKMKEMEARLEDHARNTPEGKALSLLQATHSPEQAVEMGQSHIEKALKAIERVDGRDDDYAVSTRSRKSVEIDRTEKAIEIIRELASL